MEPWQQTFACFYPHGTIFIRPSLLHGWQNMTEPAPSRFLSGHFCFADNHWAKTVLHDQDIFFSGEELNLTVRSYTHGYDMFHPHKLVIWHATMREERSGMLVWDDQSKRGDDWWTQQNIARAKIRQLLRTEDNGFDLTGYDLGTERTLHDYEKYAGLLFETRGIQQETIDKKYPPNTNNFETEEEWKKSFSTIFKHCIDVSYSSVPEKDYEYWVVAFHNDKDETLYRRDADINEINGFFTDPDGYCKVWRDFNTTQKPTYWVVWPYSKWWCDRLTGRL
jgi:hypothetical protein